MHFLVAATSLGWPVAARAQSASRSGVDLPRIEFAAAARFEQFANGAGEQRWTGPALAMTLDGRVTPHLAAAALVESDFHHATAFLGGAQVSTAFYFGSNRDPVPGRFFGRVLAGVVADRFEGRHPASQVSGGADILLSRTHPVGLRWEVGYHLIAGAVADHARGRVAIGLIVGPRLRRGAAAIASPSP